ncbi:hypothetical protein OSB04_023008 [Centaurea solstitialis]|uniref:Tubby-like F-box protein n=1 Tax=Centaurea solstitialis TaxID=347529 RepID=A0AA38SWN6_9ASTR|nr:hypothetical protein OSB04_023008 [Centaurea solstitialis]
MSFKSMIENGSDAAIVVDGLKQSCWSNMPPELLRDVLMRIEASESAWPARKNVVSCACVCKNWREIMKEIVKSPEFSGKLTFPISLKQPGSRGSLIQCFIKLNLHRQSYELYQSLDQGVDEGKFLLAGKRCRKDYMISLNAEDFSIGSNTYIGKLRTKFMGRKFTIYDAQPPNTGVSPRAPARNYPVSHISYALDYSGNSIMRKMKCVMNAIPTSSIEPGGVAPTQTEFPLSSNSGPFSCLPFFRSKSSQIENPQSGSSSLPAQKDAMLTLKNKAPRWHNQLQCWCLDFNGRVTVASELNFQLVASSVENGGREDRNVILQFGKVGRGVFTMDYRYPLSAFQAFAICLSNFRTNIPRETVDDLQTAVQVIPPAQAATSAPHQLYHHLTISSTAVQNLVVKTMSFKSMIQDMKGELGSISMKGFGSRSRSQRTMEDRSDAAVVVVDGLKQSRWANMPPELLRDVLMRIEACTWPARKNVVSCAGVCKNWREIMKEIVKDPEFSGNLTFPISLKQPGLRDSLIQCFIKRNRSTQTYHLYQSLDQGVDEGKFLLAAKKCRHATCTDYIISLNAEDVSKGSNTYIGKLRSNFLGTKFTIYDAQPPNTGDLATKSHSFRPGSMKRVSPRVPAGNYPVSHISYELNVLGTRGPRKMQCVMNAIPTSSIEPGGVAPTQTEFPPSSNSDPFSSLSSFRSKSGRIENPQSGSSSLPAQKDAMLMLKNKVPRWHQQLQCWCLNFNGRVTVASVKNFQLVASSVENNGGGNGGAGGQEDGNVILQFGKVGKDAFTMDYRYPISAFQAFAICLSSFDTKIACE